MRINRIKQTIAAFAVAGFVALIGGCNTVSDREEVGQDLQVAAEIKTVTNHSRAFDGTNYDQKSFAEGNEIYINGGATSDMANAKAYIRTSGKWKPVGDRLVVASASDQFTAIYPIEHTGIEADQESTENFWKSNLLKSTATATGNLVNFSFAPNFAKITLNITYVNAEVPTSAVITGDDIISTATTNSNVKLHRTSVATTSVNHSYVGILNTGITQFTIEVITTISGSKKHTYIASDAWVAGNNYIFNFTSKDELILNGVSVVPFTATPEIGAGNAM